MSSLSSLSSSLDSPNEVHQVSTMAKSDIDQNQDLSPSSSSTSADSSLETLPRTRLTVPAALSAPSMDPPPSPSCSSTSSTTSFNETKPSDWKLQMVESAIKDIERAEFVALDLEFSGLFRAPIRQHVLEKYFKECADSARDFMTVQIGICPVWRASNDPEYLANTGNANSKRTTKSFGQDVWRMAPYNFHVFPSDRKVFSSDSSTLSWLLGNGFSFDNWIQSGFDFTRLAYLQKLEVSKHLSWRRSLEKVKSEGLQRVIQAIIEEGKPVVMHNGLFDMLHIHHKFIDEPPATLVEFCHEWLRIFIGGTFDTKHIANEGIHTILHIGNDRGTMLNELYTTLHQKKCRSHILLAPRFFQRKLKTNKMNENSESNTDASNNQIEEKPPPLCSTSDTMLTTASSTPTSPLSANMTSTTRLPMTGTYSLTPVPTGHADSKCHEAGYDAMLTAQVFLMELELYHRQSRHKQQTHFGAKSTQNNEASVNEIKSNEAPSFSKPHIPLNWKSSDCFGKRYTNVIELVKVAPGKIDLRAIAAAYHKPVSRTWVRTPTPSEPSSASASSTTSARINGAIKNSVAVQGSVTIGKTAAVFSVAPTPAPAVAPVMDIGLDLSADDEEPSPERPCKKRRTEESEEPIYDDVEVIDEVDEKSSDVTTRGRSSEYSPSESDNSDDEAETRNEKEELLLKRVQHLREARRLKNKRLLEETTAKLDQQRPSGEVPMIQSDDDSSVVSATHSRDSHHQQYQPFTSKQQNIQPSIEHYAIQSPYPLQQQQHLAMQRRVQLPQHRPTSTWAIPLLTNSNVPTSNPITSPYGSNGAVHTTGQPISHTTATSSRRYFNHHSHLLPSLGQHQSHIHPQSLPYDSAIVAASFRVLDPTKSHQPHE